MAAHLGPKACKDVSARIMTKRFRQVTLPASGLSGGWVPYERVVKSPPGPAGSKACIGMQWAEATHTFLFYPMAPPAAGSSVAGILHNTLLRSNPGYLILFTASASVSRPNRLTISLDP
jgi:hypothetical protein